MPLLGNGEYREPLPLDEPLREPKEASSRVLPPRKQSQHSVTARIAMNNYSTPSTEGARTPEEGYLTKKEKDPKSFAMSGENNLAAPAGGARHGVSNGAALTDTPVSTAPNSPTM